MAHTCKDGHESQDTVTVTHLSWMACYHRTGNFQSKIFMGAPLQCTLYQQNNLWIKSLRTLATWMVCTHAQCSNDCFIFTIMVQQWIYRKFSCLQKFPILRSIILWHHNLCLFIWGISIVNEWNLQVFKRLTVGFSLVVLTFRTQFSSIDYRPMSLVRGGTWLTLLVHV